MILVVAALVLKWKKAPSSNRVGDDVHGAADGKMVALLLHKPIVSCSNPVKVRFVSVHRLALCKLVKSTAYLKYTL